jgi:hypothetical protein
MCYEADVKESTMKPGMQRDLLVTFWVLFDDIVNDGEVAPSATTPEAAPEPGESPPPDVNEHRD